MPYAVIFTAEAARNLRTLRAAERANIIDQCRRLLSTNPTLTSKARIKRLAGGVSPPYRLRVGDYRVFYDVDVESNRVIIHGVVTKEKAEEWLSDYQQRRLHEEDNDC